jgi:hypothetical protein
MSERVLLNAGGKPIYRPCDVSKCPNRAEWAVMVLLWPRGYAKGNTEPKIVDSNNNVCTACKGKPNVKNVLQARDKEILGRMFELNNWAAPDFSTAEILIAPLKGK